MATPSPSAETPTSSAKELSAGFSAQDTSDSSTRAVEAKSPADDFVQEYVVGFRAVLVLVPVILVYFLLMLDMSVISTAVPSITSEFNSLLDIGWYGSAYQLTSSAFQPLSGKIYTLFPTKWSFLAFFFIFELGSALCGAAQSSVMLITGRAVAGLGASGVMTGCVTIISTVLPPHRQPSVMGATIGLGQMGIALGPLIGGAFTEYATWRWCFYLNLPSGAIVAAILVLMRIPEGQYKPPVRTILGTAVNSLDLLGFALVAPAAVMFFLALQYGGNQHPWGSSTVIGLFVGAALAFVLFLFWEHRRGDNAMMPFPVLRLRVLWSGSASMFFFFGCLFCAGFYLPIYFQAVRDDTALMSGVHTLPNVISRGVFAMLAGAMIQSLGYYTPWVLGGTVVTAISYGLLSLLNPQTAVARWIGYQILYGAGTGAATSGAYVAIQNLIPKPKIPVAMATLIFFQYLGGATFTVAAQVIFSNSLRDQILQLAPGVDPDLIIDSGARSIRDLVSAQQLPAVLLAYCRSVDYVMYLGIAISVLSFAFAWGLGWKDIRLTKEGNANTSKPEAGAS